MEASLFSISPDSVPRVAVPDVLIRGLRKTVLAALFIAGAMLIAPFGHSGIGAPGAGGNLWETMKAVSVSFPVVIVVLGWVLVWSPACGAIAGMLRPGWLRRRAA